MALRKRHTWEQERLTEHTRILPPLRVGDHVRIQNQVGKDKLKWDRTGIVVEVRQYDQYVIRIDGSGRVTLRNRRFLRKFSLYEPSRHCPVPNLPSVKSIPQVVAPLKVRNYCHHHHHHQHHHHHLFLQQSAFPLTQLKMNPNQFPMTQTRAPWDATQIIPPLQPRVNQLKDLKRIAGLLIVMILVIMTKRYRLVTIF